MISIISPTNGEAGCAFRAMGLRKGGFSSVAYIVTRLDVSGACEWQFSSNFLFIFLLGSEWYKTFCVGALLLFCPMIFSFCLPLRYYRDLFGTAPPALGCTPQEPCDPISYDYILYRSLVNGFVDKVHFRRLTSLILFFRFWSKHFTCLWRVTPTASVTLFILPFS